MRKLPPGVRDARRREYSRRPEVLARRRELKNTETHQVTRRARWARRAVRRRQFECFILKKYGLTHGEYDAMLVDQCGACAMCLEHFHGVPRIDHDHQSGEVRGLLCDVCNRTLGFIERYGELAAEYLASQLRETA